MRRNPAYDGLSSADRRKASCLAWRRRNREKVNAYARKWRDANPGRALAYAEKQRARYDPAVRKRQGLQLLYGISLDTFYAKIASQGGCCALCGLPFGASKMSQPCVDHDHATGAVRGILHNMCNRAIGMFGDDPGLCEQAAAYLRSHLGTTSP